MVTGGGAYIANGLYNADCITAMRAMPNECVDMVLTDPPYNKIGRASCRERVLAGV